MRVLLVEDDAAIAKSVLRYLQSQGFAVDHASTGEDGLTLACVNAYDAAVLDVRLPGLDGLQVLERLRATGNTMRVLLATARDSIDDRIVGLDTGADDYLVKPYALGELVARLRALLRRPDAVAPSTLKVEDFVLDARTRVARRGDRIIELTNKEYAVLEYLMRRAGEIITREQLSAHAWDDNYDPASNVIDVYVARLRKKIDAEPDVPLIHTIRGAGYRFGRPTR